ncbi:SRPBCC family protein [Amycolatopsis sp. H20-H5]|uniref:SRPBCC family protein n=1 Tax=Amycolatopsis sp. H20-H5 TaxID=3046309 RepID=UPI002DBB344A|nr:SRPBCC family protein [Amycolatopsis sp. H20-H5]MEC3980704.1 SRPBCC family protein [Amycolatopsis sp. H20-H5]
MANYEYEHTVTTTAPADAVWALWSDVSRWTEWDTSLEAITLDGPFAPGSGGTMTIPGQPLITYILTEVEPGVAFSDETAIPGGVLRFGHRLTTADGLTTITHRVEIDGPPEMAKEFGPVVTEDVPEAMRALAKLAEASCRV